VTTVSGPQKAALARAAGAHYVVNYRDTDAASAIREAAPDGVDMIVEVAPAVNAALDQAVAAPNAVVAANADTGGDTLTVSVRELMFANLRWQGVVVYTVPEVAKAYAVADVAAAVADSALRAREEAGLPLHRFPLEKAQDAHAAVQNNAVGKVIVEVTAL
jgi:NADPH2:quinone reductase